MLSDFAKADQDWLDDMLRGISDGAAALAKGDIARFTNAVALRMAPPKPEKPDRPAPEPAPARAEPAEDTRSAMQRLMDKFR